MYGAAWLGALPLVAVAVTGVGAQVAPRESFTVESAVMGETRRIHVYTPPEYATAPGVRYPVLYLLDGGPEEDFPQVAAAVDSAIRAGAMKPMIMVGIENTQRRRDMTGPTVVPSDLAIAPRVGGSEAFRRFIRDELMPRVRERYPTTDETAVIGESLAGLFIVETFLLEPAMFDTYLAFSPSLWWNNAALVDEAGERLWRERVKGRSLYFSSADEKDIASATLRLSGILRSRAPDGTRWMYTPRPELTHGTIYRTELPDVLRRWLAPAR